MKNSHRQNILTSWAISGLAVTLLTGAAATTTPTSTQLVDPTRPPDALIKPSKTIKAVGPLNVTAIFLYPDREVAIIDGKMVGPGDKVGEYTIINIHRDTVELSGPQDKERTLSLVPKVKQVNEK